MTYTPSLRVLTVLELLQERETVTGAELARRLEVSPRTVQRYVMRLQDLGIPVEGKRGVGGAYRLKPGFRLPPMMFTGDEALALWLGLLAAAHLGLSDLAPAAGAARAKLSRTLPANLRAEIGAIEAAAQLDVSPWVVSADAGRLRQVLWAAHHCRAVRLTYTDLRGAATTRPVDLYRAAHVEGRWYAVGLCHLRGELRSFRLDRISALEPLEQTFTPPPAFDALALIRQGRPTPQEHPISVWIAAPPEQLRGHVSVWQTDLSPEGEGTRLRCQRERLDSFAAFLLGLGHEFRVDEPPELRAEFARLARRCAAQVPADVTA